LELLATLGWDPNGNQRFEYMQPFNPALSFKTLLASWKKSLSPFNFYASFTKVFLNQYSIRNGPTFFD